MTVTDEPGLLTEAPEPGSPEWLKLVTASKVPAIVGTSPWDSPRSMWHAMRGDIDADIEVSKAMERGNYLEPAILAWWQDRHPEYTNVIPQYFAHPEPWCAATLDAKAMGEGVPTVGVEVKTDSMGEHWGPEGTDAIPPWYRDQVDWQMAMDPEIEFVYVAALLGPRMELAEYVVDRDEERIKALKWDVFLFYLSLGHEAEPADLDDHVATLNALQALHPEIERDEHVDLDPEFAAEFVAAKELADEAEARFTGMKSRMLDAMGKARLAKVGKVTVARRQAGRYKVSLRTVAKSSDLAEVCALHPVDINTQEKE